MSGKTFTTTFSIAGKLDPSLTAAVKGAAGSLKGLKNAAGTINPKFLQAQRNAAKLFDTLNRQNTLASQYQRVQQQYQRAQLAQANAANNVARLNRAYTDSIHAVAEARQRVNALRNSSDRAAFDAANRQLQQRQASMRQAQSALVAAQSKASTASADYQRQVSALNQLGSALRQAGVSTQNLASNQATLRRMLGEVSNELQRQSQLRLNDARAAHNAAGNNFNAAVGNVSSAVDTAGSIMSPFANATKVAMTYEAALSRSKALTQMDAIAKGDVEKINREMAMLDARYKEIGRTTKFSATQAANAGNYLAMANWDANQIDQGLESVVNLALSSGADVERAADIMSNIMSGFGIEATGTEMRRVSDVLAYTTTHSNQNLSMLGDTMKYAAPVAKMFGSSLEETAALTKFMADAGIQGSMAGTSLRATMLRLVAPPKKASKALAENGITVADCAKEWQMANDIASEYGIKLDETATPGRQMAQVIDQINKNMSGLSAHEKMAAFSAITGINAVSGALNIFEQPPEKINKFYEALKGCGGAAKQTADVMADNTEGAFISLQSAIEAVQISVGGAFLPALRSVLEGATDIARAFSIWAGENPQIVQGLGAIAGALAAGIVGLAGFRVALAGINFVTTSIGLMKATSAFKAVSKAIGLANAAGAAGTLGTAAAGAASAGASAAGAVGAGAAASRVASMSRLGGWLTIGQAISSSITSGLNTAWTTITAFAARIATAFSGMTFSGVFESLISGGLRVLSIFGRIVAFPFTPLGAAIAVVSATLIGIVDVVQSRWSEISAFLGTIGDQLMTSIGNAFAMIEPSIERFRTAFDGLMATLNSDTPIVNTLMQIVDILGGTAVGAIMVFIEVFSSAVAIATEACAGILAAVMDLASGIINFISGVLQGNWSAAWSAMTSTAIGLVSNMSGVIMGILSGIASAVSNVISAISSAISMSSSVSVPSISVGSNSQGGIYPRGAFLTTFAERSAEAAIPIDNSRRAVNLWRQTGAMLGVYPVDQNATKQAINQTMTPTPQFTAIKSSMPIISRILPQQPSQQLPRGFNESVSQSTTYQTLQKANAATFNPILDQPSILQQKPAFGYVPKLLTSTVNQEPILQQMTPINPADTLTYQYEELKQNQAAATTMSVMNAPISVNVTVNVSGNGDQAVSMQEAAQAAFESAADQFRRMFNEMMHENARRSFA